MLLLKIVEWPRELRPLKRRCLISTPSGLTPAVAMLWSGCKIMHNILQNPLKVVEEL
jgi:hypothetical protein